MKRTKFTSNQAAHRSLSRKQGLRMSIHAIRLVLLCGMCLLGAAARSQSLSLEWFKGIGGSANYPLANGRDIVADQLGNIYVTGTFTETVDFDPGPGTSLLAARTDGVNTYMADVYLAKYDTDGNLIWVRSIGSKDGDDQANRVAIDTVGNVYIAGMIGQTPSPIYFDTGATAPFINVSVLRYDDAFVAKYDADGNFQWAKNFGGYGYDGAWALTVSKDGNGIYTGAMVSANTAADTSGILMTKFDTAGNEIWRKHITDNSGGLLSANGMDLDSEENLIVAGTLSYTDTVDFDPGPGTAYWVYQSAYQEAFLAKYDSAGNYIWVQGMLHGSGTYSAGQYVTVDKDDNILLAGAFNGTLFFDSLATTSVTTVGANDGYLVKYSPAGTCLWANSYGSVSLEGTDGVATDRVGNVYMTGSFRMTVDVDPGPGVVDFTSEGGVDALWVKYDANGNYLQGGRLGGSSDDLGRKLTVDNSGHVYMTGEHRSSVSSIVPGTATLPLIGFQDVYIAKLSCSETSLSELEAVICGESYTLNGQVYTTTGIYYQHFPNTLGCDSTIALDLTLHQITEPVITVDVDTLGTVQPYVTYQWLKNGALISGATNARYTVSENADYRVIVTNEHGCIDTSAIYTVTNHGVSGIDPLPGISNRIKVFPNPAEQFIQVKSPVAVDLVLTGVDGRILHQQQGTRPISLKQLSAGIYLLKIMLPDGRLVKVESIVKQR